MSPGKVRYYAASQTDILRASERGVSKEMTFLILCSKKRLIAKIYQCEAIFYSDFARE